MLKTSKSTQSTTQLSESGVGINDSSKVGRDVSELDGSRIDGNKVDSGEVRDDEVGKKVQKLSKSKNLSKFKKMVGSDFFTLRAKLTFAKLRQAFVKALILHYFDPERHNQIEIDVLDYAIGEVLNQLTLNNLDQ